MPNAIGKIKVYNFQFAGKFEMKLCAKAPSAKGAVSEAD